MQASLQRLLSCISVTAKARVHKVERVQGLHKLLSTLPVALPLAMGHEAARAATEQLSYTLSRKDALRLEKLYKLVCDDDSTTSTLKSVLGELCEE